MSMDVCFVAQDSRPAVPDGSGRARLDLEDVDRDLDLTVEPTHRSQESIDPGVGGLARGNDQHARARNPDTEACGVRLAERLDRIDQALDAPVHLARLDQIEVTTERGVAHFLPHLGHGAAAFGEVRTAGKNSTTSGSGTGPRERSGSTRRMAQPARGVANGVPRDGLCVTPEVNATE